MIGFGSAITAPQVYERHARPGIEAAAEPDSARFTFRATSSIFRSYNLILDRAAARDDLEALVLVHQDTELVDPEFCAKVRRALADPDVGVVGCIGASGVRSIAWWEGSVSWASFIHRYAELGGGDLPGFAWDTGDRPAFARTGEVDVVDGFLLVLSPWVVRNIRFDESLGTLHGYDVDLCLQVRAAGRKVITAELRAIHNHSLELVSDAEGWVEAHMRLAEKWDGRLAGDHAGSDWKQRARRAEAEAEAARAAAVSCRLRYDARERVLTEMRESIGWRLTEPLRRLNHWRRRAAARLSRRARGGSRRAR
jgi:Glycosyltransferase like family